MLSYAQALATVLEQVVPLPAVTVPLNSAAGQVLAETPVARWDLPPANNSAMDGFAFCYAGQDAGHQLTVGGFLPAGQPPDRPAPPGQALRVMTGAALPEGCDTVVPFEEVTETGGRVRLLVAPQAGQHVRRRGEELRRGQALVPAGTVLRSGEIGLLAAAGVTTLRGVHTPRVALLATGDELVELGTDPGAGRIVNSNQHMLAARLQEEGFSVECLGIARDRTAELAAKLRQGLQADLLLSTGGVSVGDHDLVRQTLLELGCTVHFWRVAIKPGKPVLFASRHGRPVFGLPGNPAAAAATCEIFALPALRRLAGRSTLEAPRVAAVLEAAVTGDNRQRFIWGTAVCSGGTFRFVPARHQQSGRHGCMPGFNALLPVAAGSAGSAAGAQVEVLLLRLPAAEQA